MEASSRITSDMEKATSGRYYTTKQLRVNRWKDIKQAEREFKERPSELRGGKQHQESS
jgi:hypothetical protein